MRKEKGEGKKEEKGREKGRKKEKRRKSRKKEKKEEKKGIEGKNLVWGKICSEKIPWGKKWALGKPL